MTGVCSNSNKNNRIASTIIQSKCDEPHFCSFSLTGATSHRLVRESPRHSSLCVP